MIPASQNFKDALAHSHTVLTRGVILQPTKDHAYEESVTLAVAEANLTSDGRRNIWRQGTVEIAPAHASDLSVFGQITDASRIRIERGIRFIDGTEEWVTMATWTVQSAQQTLGEGTMKITGYDPSACIDDFGLIDDYVANDTVVNCIKNLVDEALWETAMWTIDDGIDTTVKPSDGTVFKGSRWNAINALAKSIGAVVHCQPDGTWRLRFVDTTGQTPVINLHTGPGGVLIGGNSSRDRRNLYNAVVVRWDDPNGGGKVLVKDNDPASPTFWDGPFGRRPAPEQNIPSIDTQEQAQKAADGLLAQHKGFTATVNFRTLHNPLLEPYDLVDVQVSGVLHQIHVIDAISYNVTSGAMTCQTRAIREVAA